jgi:hypothetical protein
MFGGISPKFGVQGLIGASYQGLQLAER